MYFCPLEKMALRKYLWQFNVVKPKRHIYGPSTLLYALYLKYFATVSTNSDEYNYGFYYVELHNLPKKPVELLREMELDNCQYQKYDVEREQPQRQSKRVKASKGDVEFTGLLHLVTPEHVEQFKGNFKNLKIFLRNIVRKKIILCTTCVLKNPLNMCSIQ
jgi:hypothetical protein